MSFAVAAMIALAPALPGHAHDGDAAGTETRIDVPAAALPAVEVVDAFGDALAAGDMGQVKALLDPAVIVLEGGGAERSRAEYMDHHARADAAFLAGSHSELTRRTARSDGDTAWVASESELHVERDGKPRTLLGTETMVLEHTPSGWKIVHIHWSSRPQGD